MKALKYSWEVLADPKNAFTKLKERTLESVLVDYLKLVLLSGAAAGIMQFLVTFGNAVYLTYAKQVTIEFLRLTNYYVQIAVGTFFFYLFAGTFLFFILSVIVNALAKKVPYVAVVMALCYSMSPVLLFGWIYPNIAFVFFLWSAILLWNGLSTIAGSTKSRRTSRAS